MLEFQFPLGILENHKLFKSLFLILVRHIVHYNAIFIASDFKIVPGIGGIE